MLIHRVSFPECWRSDNVTAIHKGAPSPVGKTTVLYQYPHSVEGVWEIPVFYKLSSSHKLSGLHGCTTISHHFQKSLDTGMKSYIVQLDFSVAFDRVSHSGLSLKL